MSPSFAKRGRKGQRLKTCNRLVATFYAISSRVPSSSCAEVARKTMNESVSPIQRIEGARLTSVQFVLDYLILGFDEKGALTVLVWPDIHRPGGVLKYGMEGYRDELCSLITHVVSGAGELGDETLVVHFDNGARFEMPLSSRREAGERAILTGPNHFLHVWSSWNTHR